jgi:hypothetical protein
VELYLLSPNTPSWRGAHLKKSTWTTLPNFYLYCCSFNGLGPLVSTDSELTFEIKSRDSSVGIALGYGLDDWGSRVRFQVGAGNFSLRHRVQNGSGAHPASYPMGTRGSFPGDKAAGA